MNGEVVGTEFASTITAEEFKKMKKGKDDRRSSKVHHSYQEQERILFGVDEISIKVNDQSFSSHKDVKKMTYDKDDSSRDDNKPSGDPSYSSDDPSDSSGNYYSSEGESSDHASAKRNGYNPSYSSDDPSDSSDSSSNSTSDSEDRERIKNKHKDKKRKSSNKKKRRSHGNHSGKYHDAKHKDRKRSHRSRQFNPWGNPIVIANALDPKKHNLLFLLPDDISNGFQELTAWFITVKKFKMNPANAAYVNTRTVSLLTEKVIQHVIGQGIMDGGHGKYKKFPVTSYIDFTDYFQQEENEKELMYWLYRSFFPENRQEATKKIQKIKALEGADVEKYNDFTLSYRNFEEMVRVSLGYLERVKDMVAMLKKYDISGGDDLPTAWADPLDQNKGLINIVFQTLGEKGFCFIEVIWFQQNRALQAEMKQNFDRFCQWVLLGLKRYQKHMRITELILSDAYKKKIQILERKQRFGNLNKKELRTLMSWDNPEEESIEAIKEFKAIEAELDEDCRRDWRVPSDRQIEIQSFLNSFADAKRQPMNGRGIVESRTASKNKPPGPCWFLCRKPDCQFDHSPEIMEEYIKKIQKYIEETKAGKTVSNQFKQMQEDNEIPKILPDELSGEEAREILNQIYSKIGSKLTPAYVEHHVLGTKHNKEYDNAGRLRQLGSKT